MPKVSVFLPSYNHEKYIGQAIESVLNQTFSDFELLIGDDCSLDHSLKVITSYKDERIRVFRREENLGATINYLELLKEVSGDYVALINSDDFWYPNKLRQQVEFLNAHPDVAMCSCWATLVDENNNNLQIPDYANIFIQKNRSQTEWLRHFFLKGNCICHPGVLIRKEYYSRLNYYKIALRQLPDFDFWIRLIKIAPIHIIQDTLVAHRRFINYGENTSSHSLENIIRDAFEAYVILKDFFNDISDEVFIEAFQSCFKNKKAISSDELICEKFFLLLEGKYYIPKIGKIYAPEFIIERYSEEVAIILEKNYGFSLKDLYNLSGSVDLLGLAKGKKYSQKCNHEIEVIKREKMNYFAQKILGNNTKMYTLIKNMYKNFFSH